MPNKEEKPAKPILITSILSKLGENTPQLLKDASFQRWLMLVTLSLFIAFLLSPNLSQNKVRYKLGDVAEKDIKASRDFSVEYYPPPGKNGAETAQPGLSQNPAQIEDLPGQTNPATNHTETSRRSAGAEEPQEQAQSIVKPVYLRIKKGEIIVREGELIQDTHLIKLKAQQGAFRQVDTISIFLGSALLATIILKTFYDASLRRVKSFIAGNKNLLFFCVLLALVLIAAKISLFVIQAVTVNIPHLDPDVLLYALPVASAAMLVSVFFTADLAIIFALPASILAALLLTNTLEFFIYFL
ncbi:MAG: hypothetical protein Q8N82_06880, partial [Deltaproteobacteria bacterium]|nr:hypothetical protein [Deltaproteobacteria bacterium]